jgi:predicted nucleic acid-binding protein
MKTAVVDASVVLQLFFEEDHSAEAEQFFRQTGELLAPDLLWSETANAYRTDSWGVSRPSRSVSSF